MYQDIFSDRPMDSLLGDNKQNNNNNRKDYGKFLFIKPSDNQKNIDNSLILYFEGIDKPDSSVKQYYSHYIYDPKSKKKRFVTCIGESCPICASGHKPSAQYVFMVIHVNNIEEDPFGNKTMVPKRKILKSNWTLGKQLSLFHKNKGLDKGVVKVEKIGSGKDCAFYIDYVASVQIPQQFDDNGLSDFSIIIPDEKELADIHRIGQAAMAAANNMGINNQGYQQQPQQQPPQQSYGQPQRQAPPQYPTQQSSNPGMPYPATPQYPNQVKPNTVTGQDFMGNQQIVDPPNNAPNVNTDVFDF